eukprot:GHVU01222767.1.p1 GENE.GHVU01222767.1~~GHVU01222767.1.p1  ORF type:complete len:160 (+),score=5.42 GHVU01222767.1:197-676(+)
MFADIQEVPAYVSRDLNHGKAMNITELGPGMRKLEGLDRYTRWHWQLMLPRSTKLRRRCIRRWRKKRTKRRRRITCLRRADDQSVARQLVGTDRRGTSRSVGRSPSIVSIYFVSDQSPRAAYPEKKGLKHSPTPSLIHSLTLCLPAGASGLSVCYRSHN